MKRKIFVLGSINMDLSIKTPRFPKKGETMSGHDFMMCLGGKGLNQAVAASRLGGDVMMLGAVGKDRFGEAAIEQLNKDKINHRFVVEKDYCSTGTAMITISEKDNTIVINGGANLSIGETQVDNFLASANENDIFLTQLENNLDAVKYALKKAKEKKMFVVLNPAPMNIEIKPYLDYVDLITPNEIELKQFGGADSLSKICKSLIITLGSKGYRIIDNGEDNTFPCMEVDVIDTVGAGDTFTGGLIAQLAKGKCLKEAAKFASIAASIACTKRGAIDSIPKYNKIKKIKF